VNPDIVVANDDDEDDAVNEPPAGTECNTAGKDADKRSCGILESVGDAMEEKSGWWKDGEAGGDEFGTGTVTLGIGSNCELDSGKWCPVALRMRIAPTGG
jgi:hypothetical protein